MLESKFTLLFLLYHFSISDLSSWDKKTLHQLGSIFIGLNKKDIQFLKKDSLENLNFDLLHGKNFTNSFRKTMAAHFVKVFLLVCVCLLFFFVTIFFPYITIPKIKQTVSVLCSVAKSLV